MRRPVNHFDAYVNGLPVRLVDVSNEGLCIVTPPDRSALLPPSFNVRVPLVGVTVAVQRVWGRRAKPGASTTWYGGALTQNPAAVEQGWKAFVDTIPLVHNTPRTVAGSRSTTEASTFIPASSSAGLIAPKPSTRLWLAERESWLYAASAITSTPASCAAADTCMASAPIRSPTA